MRGSCYFNGNSYRYQIENYYLLSRMFQDVSLLLEECEENAQMTGTSRSGAIYRAFHWVHLFQLWIAQ